MAAYVRKSDDVDAEQLPSALGDVAVAGDWLVKHADGRLSLLSDAKFTADYEPAPPAAPIVEAESTAAAEPAAEGASEPVDPSGQSLPA